jgi:hypothetical protein
MGDRILAIFYNDDGHLSSLIALKVPTFHFHNIGFVVDRYAKKYAFDRAKLVGKLLVVDEDDELFSNNPIE